MHLRFFSVAQWRPARWLALAAAVSWLSVGASTAPAQTSVDVVRVEEDWELVVAEPDLASGAPQVTVVLSPVGHLNGLYAAFELNHQSQPSYVAGGMQLQVWNGEQSVATKKQNEGLVLSHPNETIRWTQKMHLLAGVLTFDVDDGTSTTWGAFGGPIASVVTSLANLNSYNPTVSVQGSGPGFAANRVGSLVLRKVRVHTSDGQVVEDATPKVAYPRAQ